MFDLSTWGCLRREDPWVCPPEGIMKINVDAAYNEDAGKFHCSVLQGIAVCGRFYDG
jgi:hypothetical protein